MAITAGSRLGAYEVLSLIGEGGMGRVFRARDTRLKREVAIKTLALRADFGDDRLARFRREAEALAALNHPHIGSIHDQIETDEGLCLVLELVDGETLSDRIRRGPIPVGETIAIARQIAEALEAAHARGIVHRDLKPANIKITSAGLVKVLDFGLAKLDAPAHTDSVGPGGPATITSPAMTMHGVVLGTAPYMSPEQARGESVDAQSDIWALGCVMYEMLTGQLSFAGRTVTDVLAAVVRGDPDWAALPADTPAGVRSLLRRCLQKERPRRLHHVADARLELEDAASHPQPALEPSRLVRTRERWAWTIAGVTLAALAGLAVAFVLARRSESDPPEMRVEINTPSSPDPVYFALSPDGLKLVFLSGVGGTSRLWIRSLDGTAAQPLRCRIELGLLYLVSCSSADKPYVARRGGPRKRSRISLCGSPKTSPRKPVFTVTGRRSPRNEKSLSVSAEAFSIARMHCFLDGCRFLGAYEAHDLIILHFCNQIAGWQNACVLACGVRRLAEDSRRLRLALQLSTSERAAAGAADVILTGARGTHVSPSGKFGSVQSHGCS